MDLTRVRFIFNLTFSWKSFSYFLYLHWYLSLFFQTFFLHRYASHAAFTMGPKTEKIFFVLTWIFQGSNYLSPFGYGVMHRMHHAFADTENDPHSPKYDESIFKMMWKTKTIYSKIASGEELPEKRFTDGVPKWEFFDKFAEILAIEIVLGCRIRGCLLFICNRNLAVGFIADAIFIFPYPWCHH